MDFMFREDQLNELSRLRWLSEEQYSRVLLLSGPSLAGKTTLVKKALSDFPVLTFVVGQKSESLLCQEYYSQMCRVLGVSGRKVPTTFDTLIDILFDHSLNRSFTVVFDEFHKLPEYALTYLSETLQTRKRKTSLNIVLMSSDQILSESLSVPEDSPLYNCVDSMIILEPFTPQECKQVFGMMRPGFSNEEFLMFYTVTGGLPGLIEQVYGAEDILSEVFRRDSYFLSYGNHVLDPLLGKNSGVYYSILQAMSAGCESQASIEDHIGYALNVGGHLAKLEMIYNIAGRSRPVFSAENARGVVRYGINSQALDFWFRWIETYRSELEAGNYDYVRHLFEDSFKKYSVRPLARYFRRKLLLEGGYTKAAGWWTPISDHENSQDIPVVATNAAKQMLAAQICYSGEDFDKDSFLSSVNKLRRSIPKAYTVNPVLFTLSDM